MPATLVKTVSSPFKSEKTDMEERENRIKDKEEMLLMELEPSKKQASRESRVAEPLIRERLKKQASVSSRDG